MPYHIAVDAKLVFMDNAVNLTAGETAIDLMKLDSIEELRILLYGIASGELSRIAMGPGKQNPQPQPTPPVNPTDASTAVGVLQNVADQFRSTIEQRTAEVYGNLNAQIEQLNRTYNDAAKSIAAAKPIDAATEAKSG